MPGSKVAYQYDVVALLRAQLQQIKDLQMHPKLPDAGRVGHHVHYLIHNIDLIWYFMGSVGNFDHYQALYSVMTLRTHLRDDRMTFDLSKNIL